MIFLDFLKLEATPRKLFLFLSWQITWRWLDRADHLFLLSFPACACACTVCCTWLQEFKPFNHISVISKYSQRVFLHTEKLETLCVLPYPSGVFCLKKSSLVSLSWQTHGYVQ